MKLGRKRPAPGAKKLSLTKYLRFAELPPPPASCDYAGPAAASLGNIYLNQNLGDCVIAGGYHVVGVETGNADGGSPFIASDAQITADYGAIGGYVPGDPATDNGCDEVTALNYWTSHGFANGTKLAAWVKLDASNPVELQQALYLSENLYFGIELPDAWVDPMPGASGFTWGVAGDPNPQNGHCVMGCGFDACGVLICSWGMLGTLTWGAIAAYCTESAGGEVYALLTPDQVAKGQAKAPNGVAWADLLSDFRVMAS